MPKGLNRLFILSGEANATALWAFLKANWRPMAEKGTPLSVEVSEFKRPRSKDQNARYWGFLVRNIEEQAWLEGRQYPGEVWHDYFKRKFIGVIDGPFGQTYAMSSRELPSDEFTTFMDKVEAFAATELGVIFED